MTTTTKRSISDRIRDDINSQIRDQFNTFMASSTPEERWLLLTIFEHHEQANYGPAYRGPMIAIAEAIERVLGDPCDEAPEDPKE